MTDATLATEAVPIEDIEQYDNNPKHNEDAVDALLEAVPKFGFKVPVVLDEENTIAAGHARVAAVEELEGTLDDTIADHRGHNHDAVADNLEAINEGKVWAIRAGGLTEDEIAEFRISDNRVGELSDWDDTKLQFELREIEEAVGFDNEEIESIIGTSGTEVEVDEDDIAEAEEELESHYEELSEDKQDRKSRLPCPNCDSWIYVDVEELERALIREGVIADE